MGFIRFFRVDTVYVPLPLIVALLLIGPFIFLGAAYAAGIIRGPVYAGCLTVLSIATVLILIVLGGLFLYVRFVRQI